MTRRFLIISLLVAISSAFSVGVILHGVLLSRTAGPNHRMHDVPPTSVKTPNQAVQKFERGENHAHLTASRTEAYQNEAAWNSRTVYLNHSSILNKIKQDITGSNNTAHDYDCEEKEGDKEVCRDDDTLASCERSACNNGMRDHLARYLYKPDMVHYLDGNSASSLCSDAACHEALVNPAMITHPNPERVAIIGGTGGATLREVLKHRSVEEVFILEVDPELSKTCKDYMLEWSDCVDIEESDANSCVEDSRVSFVFNDSHQWMIDMKENIDVIIMDTSNPAMSAEMIGSLFHRHQFADSLFNSLSEEGVLAVQLANQPALESDSAMDKTIVALQNAGFQSMHTYDEARRQFLVSLKSYTSRARWYKTSPEIAIEVHKRLPTKTKSGKPAFLLFDAHTMIGYQVPHKRHENTYCQKEDMPWECEEYLGIDPDTLNIPSSHLTVQKSTVGEFAGRGLFAARDIPEGSMLDIGSGVKSFEASPSTTSIIEGLYKWAEDNANYHFVEDEISSATTFIYGYGYAAEIMGETHYTVDSSVLTFCNHGCNGTYNHGEDDDDDFRVTEISVDVDQVPEFILNKAYHVYSPVFERHLRQVGGVGDVTLRDIVKGEEILCNYLSFTGLEDWKDDVIGLRDQCAGDTMGDIAEYESKGQ